MDEPRIGPETILRLLAMHVTNVATVHHQALDERQRRVIHHCARLLRDIANTLSPPVWNPRQRWDKLEARRQAAAVSGQSSAISDQPKVER